MLSPPDSVDESVFRLPVSSSSQIMSQRYLVNGLNSFDKTDRKYTPDDLIRFWRSKVMHWFKYVVVKSSMSVLRRRSLNFCLNLGS